MPANQYLRAAAVAALATAAARGAAAQTVAITGGTVYPVSGPKIENGTVLLRDGRVVAVGANVTVPAGAQRVDATGKWVTPGFVNGATQIGVVDVSAVAETRDASATGQENIAAAFRVWEGYNPRSVLIAPAREEGVTTIVVAPSGGMVAGQAAITDLDAPDAATRTLRGPVAMVAQLGSSQGGGATARGELIGKMRELLLDARFYGRNRTGFERGDARELTASRADLDALQPVLTGRLPLLVAVDRASDIEATLDLAKELGCA
jgi:imidazolonepropionase-like amidohydrolase